MLRIIDNLSGLSMKYSYNNRHDSINKAGPNRISNIPRIFLLDDDTC